MNAVLTVLKRIGQIRSGDSVQSEALKNVN